MKVKIQGGTGTLELADATFGVAFNEPLVHQVITAYLAGGRAGTKAQKNRSDVSGSGKKPWKQKGTGRARVGSIRSPIWVGGGRTFAARPRSFEQKVNRKMYRGAMCAILSELNRQGRLTVVEAFEIAEPKTKTMIAAIDKLGLSKRPLIVTESGSEALYLAARNIPYVQVRDVQGLDPAALVGAEHVVMTSEAVKKIEEWLA
jgi:large subunit ribosomal protein L4